MHGKLLILEDIINFAKKKFGGEFNEVLFLSQLTYFKDVELIDMEFIGSNYNESSIKKFLEEQVEIYLSSFNKNS